MSLPVIIPLETTTYVYEILSERLPLSITLKSAEAGRKIEISTDGGFEYFLPLYDTTSATMLVVAITAPITHIKVTGAINDTFTFLT